MDSATGGQLAQAKAALRKEALARRAAMSAEVRAAKSALVCERAAVLLAEQLANVENPVVALYSAYGTELSLDTLVVAARERGWRIAMPCMVAGADGEAAASEAQMVFVHVSCETALAREAAFLSKPARAVSAEEAATLEVVEPADIDAMVVPLVAFDSCGGRLGYGGGNYDRYLPQLRPECTVVAVAFEEVRVESVPVGSLDCALAQVISA